MKRYVDGFTGSVDAGKQNSHVELRSRHIVKLIQDDVNNNTCHEDESSIIKMRVGQTIKVGTSRFIGECNDRNAGRC